MRSANSSITNLPHLGHIITLGGLRVQEEKVEALNKILIS